MFMTKVRIGKFEVGLWFRHGDFHRLLLPGSHWIPKGLFGAHRVEKIDVLETLFNHKMLDALLEEDAIVERLNVVDLKDNERAFVWKQGRLGWILGPGRYAFWKQPHKLNVERFDIHAFKLEHDKIEAVLGHPGGANFLEGVRVESYERVLLFREGELVEQLGAGLHVYWKHAGKITWKAVDLREQVVDVAGQEIMTADKLTLRVNLVVSYQVTDAHQAITSVGDYSQVLYREAQLVLREAVGSRSLDKLLADKHVLSQEVAAQLAKRVASFGVNVSSVGLRDLILPGDMKGILNEVLLAQKQAEANLIRRREETAAARSQANTAKLLSENPTLHRMKELEALQDILAGAKVTFVLGQGDLSDQVRGLINQDDRG